MPSFSIQLFSKLIPFALLVVFHGYYGHAQNVGIGTNAPAASAQLDVSSGTKGFLMPRMNTSQRNSIVSPAKGLTIYNSDDDCTDSWNGSQWIKNCGASQTVDTASAQWVQKLAFAGGATSQGAGFSIGNKGYLGMGILDGNNFTSNFWEYDPVENGWTQKASFPGTARGLAVGFSIGEKGYFGTGGDIYGSNLFKDFWEYNPASNIWTRKQDFNGTARKNATGFSIGNKGYIGLGQVIGYLKDFWEYDPLNDQWTRKPDFPTFAKIGATGFGIGNKGYIANGYGVYQNNQQFEYPTEFWEYNPANEQWTQKQDFGGTGRSNAAGFVIQGKAIIGSGYFSNDFLKDFWEYDPTTDKWTKIADIGGDGRNAAIGFSIGNRGYVGTGNSSSVNLNDFWEYNPYPLKSSFSPSPAVVNAQQYNDGSWTRKADSLFTSSLQTRVGIGISPARRLDVSGSGGLRVSTTNAGSGTADWIAGNFGGATGDRVVMGLLNGHATIGAHNNGLSAWANLIINADGGNVGIGTGTPLNKLDVEGGIAIGAAYSGTSPAPANGAIIQGSMGIGTATPVNKMDLEGALAIGVDYSGTSAAPANGAIIQGNVVIGNNVSASNATLEVFGSAKIGKSGTNIGGIIQRTVALAAGPFNSNSNIVTSFPFAGAVTGGSVVVSPSAALPNGIVIAYAWVSGNGQVDVVLRNTTGASIAYPGGINLYITVITP